jgi:hypothetical protein
MELREQTVRGAFFPSGHKLIRTILCLGTGTVETAATKKGSGPTSISAFANMFGNSHSNSPCFDTEKRRLTYEVNKADSYLLVSTSWRR